MEHSGEAIFIQRSIDGYNNLGSFTNVYLSFDSLRLCDRVHHDGIVVTEKNNFLSSSTLFAVASEKNLSIKNH